MRVSAVTLLKHPLGLVALGFGSGLMPRAPGTAGSLVALGAYFIAPPLAPQTYLLILLGAFLLGVWACDFCARRLGQSDPGVIVWDEFTGLWAALFLMPGGWQWVLLGFVLFRFFDIVKPWPVSWCDRHVKGGLGIMLDDLMAGIISFICIKLIYYLSFSYAN